LESSLSRKIMVQLVPKEVVNRIFLTLLTGSVQQMLKLHRMMDGHFLRCRTVLGVGCDEGNLILSCQFAEAAFADTWRARLIGSDAFSETGNVRCAMSGGSSDAHNSTRKY
jgi:hypothetical protein